MIGGHLADIRWLSISLDHLTSDYFITGNVSDAHDLALGHFDLTRQYVEHAESLVQLYVGQLMNNSSIKRLVSLASQPDADPSFVSECAARLRQHPPMDRIPDHAIRGSFAISVAEIEKAYRSSNAYLFHVNKVIRSQAQAMRFNRDHSDKPYSVIMQLHAPSVDSSPGRFLRPLFRILPNGEGRGWESDQYFLGYSWYRILATRQLLEIKLALQRFKHAEDRFPAKLEDLTPRYLNQLPVDPISGGSFLYLPERGVVYSVGENLMDNQATGDDLL